MADTRKELLKLKEKKQCRACQEEVLLDAKFCPYCGARQGKVTFAEIKRECEEQKGNVEQAKQEPVKRGRPKKETEKKEETKSENKQNQE